ncbi:hypothetical protein E4U32_005648 [Claviceps aff. humidiphila group G2b]|nr:hypothetical protein E4U32_005648 [Claviceps aff. humidiphila group G2b]
MAGIIAQRKYLIKLYRALIMYGAPTHRLEEYMSMSSRALEIEASTIDESTADPAEVKLVRVLEGIDLWRLQDVHDISMDVAHDRLGVEEAAWRLDEVLEKRPNQVLAPFAFEAVEGLEAGGEARGDTMSDEKLADEKLADEKLADENLQAGGGEGGCCQLVRQIGRLHFFAPPGDWFEIKSIICNQLAASPSSMIDRCLTEPILRGIDHLRLKTEIRIASGFAIALWLS